MSVESHPEPVDAEVVASPPPGSRDGSPAAEVETVDGVPVLEHAGPLMPATPPPGALSPVSSPTVQAVAAAATGFVAGAATLALVRRRGARRLARRASGPRRAVDALPIVGTRTFLIDVHLLKPGE